MKASQCCARPMQRARGGMGQLLRRQAEPEEEDRGQYGPAQCAPAPAQQTAWPTQLSAGRAAYVPSGGLHSLASRRALVGIPTLVSGLSVHHSEPASLGGLVGLNLGSSMRHLF